MPTFISHGVYARLHNAPVRLEGVHHVTLITGDAPRNVDFYTRVLGLRLVKKTVNQDDPTVYHLFYADEKGSAGSDITFFEYPGARARQGRPGHDPHDHLAGRLGGRARLLGAAPAPARRERSRARTGLRLRGSRGGRPRARCRRDRGRAARREASGDPRGARAPGLRRRPRVRDRSRSAAGSCSRRRSRFEPRGENDWEARGDQRGGFYAYDPAPDGRGIPGAGTVHHVAWATHDGRARGVAAARCRGRAAADARDRPLLLQVDLLPRAERHPLRARDARARLRRSTRTPSTSASDSRCRRRSSTCASRSSPC